MESLQIIFLMLYGMISAIGVRNVVENPIEWIVALHKGARNLIKYAGVIFVVDRFRVFRHLRFSTCLSRWSDIQIGGAIRITVIGVIIYYKGMSAYYMAHTFVGRIVFHGLSIMLYFIVFTKAQIVRQK